MEACSFSPARAQRLVHIEHARVLVALVSDAFSNSPDCLAELGHALERDLLARARPGIYSFLMYLTEAFRLDAFDKPPFVYISTHLIRTS